MHGTRKEKPSATFVAYRLKLLLFSLPLKKVAAAKSLMPHVPSGFSRHRTRELLYRPAEQLQSRTDKQMERVNVK